VNEPPAPIQTLLSNCPVAVNRLLMRMIEKDRERRHQGYPELLAEILQTREQAAVWEQSDVRQQRRMAQPEPARSSSRRVYAVAVLAALLLAAGYVYGRRAGHPEQATSAMTLADPSDRRDFIQSIQKLPPVDGLERVMAKLRELNPQFDGKKNYAVEEDAITELSFSSVGVKNMWPLCALKHLRVLNCPGDAANRRRSEFADLSPLAEMEDLEELDCSWTNVENLQPLAKLPLNTLRCAGSRVSNLSPLHGLSLVELDLTGTSVTDLTPLKGLPLVALRCKETKVRDLSPLRGAPLKHISFDPLIRGEGELVRSWPRLETINDAPPRVTAGRLPLRPPK
jgi:hypothetical protein